MKSYESVVKQLIESGEWEKSTLSDLRSHGGKYQEWNRIFTAALKSNDAAIKEAKAIDDT